MSCHALAAAGCSRSSMLALIHVAGPSSTACRRALATSAPRSASFTADTTRYRVPCQPRPSARMLFSTSAVTSTPSSSPKAHSLSQQTSASTSSASSPYMPPLTSATSTAASSRTIEQNSPNASVDAACATLSPSSPASRKSQKDPRTDAPLTKSPATPAPSAADLGPASPSSLRPADAAEMAKKPSVAATMPEATSSATDAPTPAPSDPTPVKRSADRGTKFRSRTAALKLTPTAVLRLRELLESDAGPKLIRVGVRNKGCAGMSYHLEYIKPEEAARFDERVKQDGVEVLIDSKALFSIIGSEMDWQEDRLSAKFVFNNPNVKEACGCGESFL
ncbi:hypothetical protein BCV70DRAFT_199206, partial [Testicularia cyperi]